MRRKIQFIWFVSLLCSFGYELPLFIVSSIDKFNPRLYDVLFVLGLFIFNTKILTPNKNRVLNIWGKTIIWMSICAFITFLIVPHKYGIYSIYYAFRYFQGYLIIKMLFLCREFIKIHTLEVIFIVIGLIVSVFSIPQYLGRTSVALEASPDQVFSVSSGIMIGPYSSTYFALAQIIPICLLFCINRILRNKKQFLWWAPCALLFLFIGTNCGSRTAFLLTVGGLLVYFLVLSPGKTSIIALTSLGILLAIWGGHSGGLSSLEDKFFSENATLAREKELEGTTDSASSRVDYYKGFKFETYDLNTMMPICGSGFYVSPINGRYRVGYGFHNNYIFAVEQMGILGLLLFLILLFVVLRGSYSARHNNDVGKVMFAFTLVLCVANMTGQIFWQGFGTCDMNTLVVFLMALSIEPNISYG